MKTRSQFVLIVLAVVALSMAAWAEETTVILSGKIVCAKCSLKKADAKECQNVLVVAGDQGGEYYVAANDTKGNDHVCTGEKAVTMTGTVTEKDGKKWITPSKIEAKVEEKK